MANTHNAKGHRNGHAAQLSNEALIFRSVLRTHIARQLQHQMLNVPVGLLSDANAQYKTGNDDLVTYDELERVFDDVTTNFENSCHEQLEQSLEDVPMTIAAIETQVVAVMNNILIDGRVEWGRMVATVAFVTTIALKCSHSEMPHVIEPLIDHAAHLADEQFVPFIRQNGDWAAFTLAFRNRSERRPGNTTIATIAQIAAGAIGVGILAVGALLQIHK
jgi:methyl coenzyme M reductase alpha subunit